MKVHQIFLDNSYRNFNYLLEGQEGLYCIDPLDTDLLKKKIDSIGKPLVALINTHEHWDHIGGNAELVRVYEAKLWAHGNAANSIKDIDRIINDGDSFSIEDRTITFKATPGHTRGHMCIFVSTSDGKTESLFTGDTLFVAGVGNCHSEGGDPEVLYNTVSSNFFDDHEDCLVYPGHDYAVNNLGFTLSLEPNNFDAYELLHKLKDGEIDSTKYVSTLDMERRINAFFRLDSKEIRSTLSMERNSDKDVFLKLRELRNNW